MLSMVAVVVVVVVVVVDDDSMHVKDSSSHSIHLRLTTLVEDSVDYMMNHHSEILVLDIDDNLPWVLKMRKTRRDCVELDLSMRPKQSRIMNEKKLKSIREIEKELHSVDYLVYKCHH